MENFFIYFPSFVLTQSFSHPSRDHHHHLFPSRTILLLLSTNHPLLLYSITSSSPLKSSIRILLTCRRRERKIDTHLLWKDDSASSFFLLLHQICHWNDASRIRWLSITSLLFPLSSPTSFLSIYFHTGLFFSSSTNSLLHLLLSLPNTFPHFLSSIFVVLLVKSIDLFGFRLTNQHQVELNHRHQSSLLPYFLSSSLIQ